MSSSLQNQKIYFVCKGTSTNDIINSINANIGKKPQSFFSMLFTKKKTNENNNIKKIDEDQFSSLDNIGIKEMYMCQGNEKNKKILKLDPANYPNVYTSLDYDAIESSLVLYKDIPNFTIFPLPYISSDTNIKSKKSFDIFKKKLGNYIPKNNETTINKYWNTKIINNTFFNIKKINGFSINWENTLNKNISSLSSYNFSMFKKRLEEICFEQYKTENHILVPLNKIVIICNPKLIVDILKLCKAVRYNKKNDIIERSSVWEISVDFKFMHTGPMSIIKKHIMEFKTYDKIYPTEYNHSPLKYDNNKYSYDYNNNKYPLFNSLENIPLKYIKTMDLDRLSSEKRAMIKKVLTKNNRNLKEKINNTKKEINTSPMRTNTFSFENAK